jgi:hypothetical protein
VHIKGKGTKDDVNFKHGGISKNAIKNKLLLFLTVLISGKNAYAQRI